MNIVYHQSHLARLLKYICKITVAYIRLGNDNNGQNRSQIKLGGGRDNFTNIIIIIIIIIIRSYF